MVNGRGRTEVRKREEEEKKARQRYAKGELNGIYITSIIQTCINQ